jgi:hypothetical protein
MDAERRRRQALDHADAAVELLAVAVGFEPTEGLPSHAFEACSFGRSDTPPPERLQAPLTPEERA